MLWLWIAIVIMVYNISRVDVLVFGAGFYDRGKCSFGGHDCIINEGAFVYFFLIPKINSFAVTSFASINKAT